MSPTNVHINSFSNMVQRYRALQSVVFPHSFPESGSSAQCIPVLDAETETVCYEGSANTVTTHQSGKPKDQAKKA